MKNRNTSLLYTFILFFVSLLLSACSGTQVLTKGEPLYLEGTSRVITSTNQQLIARNLTIDSEKLTATNQLDGSSIDLERSKVSEIRFEDRKKGMYRGASIGAGIGAGLGILAGLGDASIILPAALSLGTTFGLTGGLIGLIGGYSNTYLLSETETSLTKRDRHLKRYRRDYYLGLELKGAWGNTPRGDKTNTLGSLHSISSMGSVLEIGATLNPNLLLGLRFSGGMNASEFNSYNDYQESFQDNYVLVTYFPAGEGRFWRFGIGGVNYNYWNWGYYEPLDHETSHDEFRSGTQNDVNKWGVAGLVGMGYAYWLGDRWNVTLSADMSNYFFNGQEESSHIFSINVGSYWY